MTFDVAHRVSDAHIPLTLLTVSVTVWQMWRMHVLAKFLRWYGLLEEGYAMITGEAYRRTIYDDRNFPVVSEPFMSTGGGE